MAAARLDVLLGGGRGAFLSARSQAGRGEDGSRRKSGRLADIRRKGFPVISSSDELERVKALPVVGLFAPGALPYALDRVTGQGPTLAGMVRAALRVLAGPGGGFLLVAEEAHIDWTCHGNDAAGCAAEVRELDRAVAEALRFAQTRDGVTVIVTADHETGGMKIADPSRLHFLRSVRATAKRMAALADASSKNLRKVLAGHANMAGLSDEEVTQVLRARARDVAIGRLVSSRGGVSWSSTGHTETPVPIYASGPGAENFARHMDNTQVAGLVAKLLSLARFTPDERVNARSAN
jgi:alkaline phosphatase